MIYIPHLILIGCFLTFLHLGLLAMDNLTLKLFMAGFIILMIPFIYLSIALNLIGIPLALIKNDSLFDAVKSSLMLMKKYGSLYFYLATKYQMGIFYVPQEYIMRTIVFRDTALEPSASH
jgi:hypothetical protein